MTKTELAEELRQLILKKDESKIANFLAEHFSEWPQDMQTDIATSLVAQGLGAMLTKQYSEYKKKADTLGDICGIVKEQLGNVEGSEEDSK